MEHDTASMTRIYQQWHDHARNRDTAALIGLYADDAVFESPLVPVIMHTDSGILRGRERILAFLEEAAARTNWCAGTVRASIWWREIRWSGNTLARRLMVTRSTFWS